MKRLPKIGAVYLKAWGAMSEWKRREGADENGFTTCVTCPPHKKYHWKTLDAGHFYHGKWWLSGMDDRNIWRQCTVCNRHKHGNLIEYSEFLRKKYGAEIIDTLRELRHTPWKPTRDELMEKYEYYKQKLSELNGG